MTLPCRDSLITVDQYWEAESQVIEIEGLNHHRPIKRWYYACCWPDSWNTVHFQKECVFLWCHWIKLANTTLLWWAQGKLWLDIVIVLHTWIILVAIFFYYSPLNREMGVFFSTMTLSKSSTSCCVWVHVCAWAFSFSIYSSHKYYSSRLLKSWQCLFVTKMLIKP